MALEDELRATVIMRQSGFPDDEVGPYVTELRALTLKQVKRGLSYRSAGTWAQPIETIPAEDRAKALLWVEFEREHGYLARCDLLDGDWREHPLAWLGDKWRRFAARTRRRFGPKNPYKSTGGGNVG